MPLSTDVRLPRDHQALFPDACCVCLRERPGDRYAVTGRRWTLAELMFPWLWLARRPVRCEVPVCTPCLRTISRRRWRQRGLYVLCGAGAIGLLMLFAPRDGPRSSRRLLQIAIGFGAFLPAIVWGMVRPPAFDLTVGAGHVDYEFASAAYAELFRAANGRVRSGPPM